MRSPNILALLVSLVAAPLGGCIIVTSAPANLTINVTFAGSATCPAAVASLQIVFPNGDSQNAGQYICGNPIVYGIALGTYRVEVDALDSSNNIIFTATQDITVGQGGTTVTMNLAATGQTGLIADFFFGGPQTSSPTAAGYMSCAEAGAQSVLVIVDSGAPLVADCHNATTGIDQALVPLTAGSHTLTWSAFDGANGEGNLLYQGPATPITMPATDMDEVSFDLVGATGKTGSFSLSWNFQGTATGCPTGVTTMSYDILDSTGKSVLATSPSTSACSSGGVMSSALAAELAPGVYTLSNIQGLAGTTVQYQGPVSFRLYAPAGAPATFSVTLNPATT